MPIHLPWGPPPPPPHHRPPHAPWGYWGAQAELHELSNLLQRYLSPTDVPWAVDIVAHDPGPGRLHSLLLLALLERMDVLLERSAGGGRSTVDCMVSEP